MRFKIKLHFFVYIYLFTACTNLSTNINDSKTDSMYLNEGNRLALATFDTLRISLQKAIAEKGFDGAVPFCNLQALTLTNTYKSDDVLIKRVSLKFRNPGNAPDSLEREVLNKLVAVQQPQIIRVSKNEVHYFKPIIMQAMCLSCHGDPKKDIQPKVKEEINRLYPDDKAIGYKEGELRGSWHLIFLSKNQSTTRL